VRTAQAKLQPRVADLRQIAATLNPATAPSAQRQAAFQVLQQHFGRSTLPLRKAMAAVMAAFAPGLFVGGDDPDLTHDNLDLERFFRCPKGHERRIHGHCHAGVRIVREGPTLVPTLDAHLRHPEPFSIEELRPYAQAPIPEPQRAALHRHRIMRQARSAKRRPALLKQLESSYANSS
jgi:hypothetical protein